MNIPTGTAQQLSVLKNFEQTEVHLPLFLVDKVRVLRRYLEDRQIKYPMEQVDKQTGLLREIFAGAQTYVSKLASMPTEDWNAVADVLKLFNKGVIKEKKSQTKVGVPEAYSKAYKVENYLDLHSAQFWINFNVAYKKNQKRAIEVLSMLKSKDVKSVEMELKDVCPDLVNYLKTNGDLFYLSAEMLSVDLLGRIVPEKQLYDACTSRSYQPKLFDRHSKKVTVEELKDKILHELTLSQLAEVVVLKCNRDSTVVASLSASSLIILDGKQEIDYVLCSLCTVDVEGCRLLVVLNSTMAEASDVANRMFGSPSLKFLLRTSEATKIDETCVMLQRLPESMSVALFFFEDSNQPVDAGSLLEKMCQCNVCLNDVVVGAEFDELYKLVGSQELISVVAQLSVENDFLLDSILRNMQGFKKIVLLATNAEHKIRVEGKVDQRRQCSSY
uniref:Uncharacterized protein n=1 Tax=Ditylenchus dipsaci TaxID=166011 RepID=A0A915EWF5_9BILA